MKHITFLFAVFLSLNSFADYQDIKIATCQFEGKSLQIHLAKNGEESFPDDVRVGEYVLIETVNLDLPEEPSQLKISRAYYDAKGTRRVVTGAPLTRVGYTRMGDIISLSYTPYDYSDTRAFQILTDGKTSTISYTQSGSGWGARGFQGSLDCTIHSEPEINSKPIDMASKTPAEKLKVIDQMKYKRRSYFFDGIAKVFKGPVHSELLTTLENFVKENVTDDFVKTRHGEMSVVKWQGCGELQSEGSYNEVRVFDFSSQTIGYYLEELVCKNKLQYEKKQFDRDTGKEIDPIVKEEFVKVGPIYLDTQGNLLNMGDKDYGVKLEISRW